MFLSTNTTITFVQLYYLKELSKVFSITYILFQVSAWNTHHY